MHVARYGILHDYMNRESWTNSTVILKQRDIEIRKLCLGGVCTIHIIIISLYTEGTTMLVAARCTILSTEISWTHTSSANVMNQSMNPPEIKRVPVFHYLHGDDMYSLKKPRLR